MKLLPAKSTFSVKDTIIQMSGFEKASILKGLASPEKSSGNSGENSEEIIPWKDTSYRSNARETLLKMLNYLGNDSPVGIYLKRNVSHLLERPQGDTGVPFPLFEKKNLLENKDAFFSWKNFHWISVS